MEPQEPEPEKPVVATGRQVLAEGTRENFPPAGLAQ